MVRLAGGRSLTRRAIVKKNCLLGLFLTALGILGAALSGGCGSVTQELQSDEFINLDGPEKGQVFFLTDTKQASEAGNENELEIHEISSSTSFDPLQGTGYANFSGETLVVEYLNSYANVWIDGQKAPRFSISMYFDGTFVPGDGTWTESMEKLVNVRISTGGTRSVYDWSEMDPIPGCEGDVIFNITTGERCWHDWETDPRLNLNWDGSAQLSQNECRDGELCPPKFWNWTNFSVNINGGIITSARVWMQENHWTEGENPENWTPWSGGVNFEGFITGDYDIPVPTPGGGGSGGGGRG